MTSLTLGGLITLIAGVIWKLFQLRSDARRLPAPAIRLQENAADQASSASAPSRGEAFAAWLKIERTMRAQGATPEQIRAAGLACLETLIVEGAADEA